MKVFFVLLGLVSIIYVRNASGVYLLKGISGCINVWDEGCSNGGIPGSGRNDDFINGGFNPGKRCVNMWDDGCSNGQLPDAGKDDDFMNGGFNPGKRCVGKNCNGGIPDLGNAGNFLFYKLLAKIHRNRH